MRGLGSWTGLAGAVGAFLLFVPTPADAGSPHGKPARPVVQVAPATPAGTPPRVSPYAFLARRHAQEAAGVASAPTVPPLMKHTRQPIGRQPGR